MKKLVTVLCVLLLLTVASGAMAAGKLTSTQETLRVLPSYGGYTAYFYAEVTNSGNKTVQQNDALLELFNADGDTIDSSTWLNCYPEYLEPGETGYVWTSKSLDGLSSAADVDDFSFTITGKGANENPVHYLPSTIRYEIYKGSWRDKEYFFSTLTNDTDATVYNFVAVMAAKDAEGNLVWCGEVSPYYVGIPAGGSVELYEDLSYDSMMDQLKTDGVDLSTLQISVIGYYEADD